MEMSTYAELFESICRVCLVLDKSEKMVPLIDKSGLSFYAKALLAFANIVIEKQEEMPSFMCMNCLCLLRQAIYFKLKCESSDRCLKNIAKEIPNSNFFKEKLVEYSMFKLYLPSEPVIETPEKQHSSSNMKPKSNQAKNTEINSTKTDIALINSCDITSRYDPKVDCMLDQLDLQFGRKKKKDKPTNQMKCSISVDNFNNNVKLAIESRNHTKRKYSTSDISVNSKKVKNEEGITDSISPNNTSTVNAQDRLNLSNSSDNCILDRLELKLASTSKNIKGAEQLKTMLAQHNADNSCEPGNKPESKDLDNTGMTYELLRSELLDPSTHDSGDESDMSVDGLLYKLESQFVPRSKKTINSTKQVKKVANENNLTNNSLRSISADIILDELQSKFASKIPINLIESEKPLKRKKMKITKMYREKRKKILEKKRSIKNKLTLVCNLCNKVLANRHTYEQHMQRHNGCRYICEHCGKGFPVLYELQTHQVSQHGIGPHLKCSQCPFIAARKFDLIEHERIHSGERPYTCDKCGLTFRRRGIWKKHLIYHSEKTVQCPQCPRKFFQRSEMLAHANNIHDRIYVYLCSKCGATYAKAATVRRHMSERHGIAKELQGKVIRINKGSSYNEQ